ncbi:putative mitochondrial protein AtMg00310 [Apium graveolens]|uniref:putative mitochondrial protein AtMg00310 n=1 Tax=Apium graveolens TaxID=4045 RepID=UPI003D79C4DB
MHIGRHKNSVFVFLVDRVEKKLQTWSSQNISKAGKVTLLKSTAQSMPNFWMNLLLIPVAVCESIERKMNAYWWGTGKNRRGIKWISWDRLCEAKEGGGLGFRKIQEFNIAMLSKQAWRLLNDANPLVTQLMKSRYYVDSEFTNANLGANPSYMWRSILAAQEMVKQGGRRWIGDGQDTRVWQVQWLPCRQNGLITSEMPPELEQMRVNSLMQTDCKAWDEELVRDLFNDRDMDLILRIPLSIRSNFDSWYWVHDNDGHFTVRSCYRQLRGERE